MRNVLKIRKIFIASWILLASFLWFSCGEELDEDYVNPALQSALALAENQSFKKYDIDWEETNTMVIEEYKTNGFKSAMIKLLDALDDDHSYYISSMGEWYLQSELPNYTYQDYQIDKVEGIGYIKVPGFFGSGSTGAGRSFAEDIQESIRNQDKDSISYWIVDLSENTGGNMYPMIAGLGPFYSETILGYFINPEGVETIYGYINGSSFVQDEITTITSVSDPYQLKNPNAKVAVIIDRKNGSSGEATAISFKGRPNTRFFGQPTYGVSTAISQKELSNGGVFGLAVAKMADRNKHIYGEEIIPDVFCEDSEALNAAINSWFGY